MTKLSKIFDYSLEGKTYKPLSSEIRLIYDKSVDKTYWSKKGYYLKFKERLKSKHYFGQFRRCAYCRTKLRTDGYWEDLDHIVPKTIKENWIFYPKNLIVTCGPCNRLKSDEQTLSNINSKYFPLYSNGFDIFNPHFDKWSDHFEIKKGIFLKGKSGTKGPQTYKHCHLYRHDIIIDYADELRMKRARTLRRLTHRLRIVEKGSNEETSINRAIDHLLNR